jgi:hypothetical protein
MVLPSSRARVTHKMTDLANDTPGADIVSKESYEKVKSELETATAGWAAEKASNLHLSARERTRITGYQPSAKEFMDGLVSEAVDEDCKTDLMPMQVWATEYHTKPNVLNQVSLARTFACASAALKRSRDEASANKEAASSLGVALKDLEAVTCERDKLRQRCDELGELVDERQHQIESLGLQLGEAGLVANKFNFSKVASRETDPKPEVSSTDVLEKHTSNASGAKTAPSPMDSLLSDIFSRGTGSLRMVSSNTNHTLLGSSNAPEFDIAHAIRSSA